MRYSTHYYNERGEFSFFRLGFLAQADAEQDACDELTLPTRVGYRAEVRARAMPLDKSIIVAHVAPTGEITYV